MGTQSRSASTRASTAARKASSGTGAVKCAGNYAASLLAQEQAIAAGCDQVVWLDAFEKRYVEETEGFEWFELLRPQEGTDQYLVYTRWSSEEAYRSWESSQDFARAHEGGGSDLAPAASDSHHLWSYEVLESTGPKG